MTSYEVRISDWSSDVCSSDLDQWMWRFDSLAHGRVARALAKIGRLRSVERTRSSDCLCSRVLCRRCVYDGRPALGGAAERRPRGGVTSSVERRVGKGCVRTCISRWWQSL